jgi:hypothetical protein
MALELYTPRAGKRPDRIATVKITSEALFISTTAMRLAEAEDTQYAHLWGDPTTKAIEIEFLEKRDENALTVSRMGSVQTRSIAARGFIRWVGLDPEKHFGQWRIYPVHRHRLRVDVTMRRPEK